jgi:protein gp37
MSTKIDWTNTVWNPVWGCLHGCEFCYARKFAKRFYRNVARVNNLNEEETKRLRNFQPVFLPANYCRKFEKKEKIIFVNSMSDIAFWKDKWIEKVFERIEKEKDKFFLFLTKDPKAYEKFSKELPDNIWLGISACRNRDFQRRTKELLDCSPTKNIFVSLEPLLEELDGVSLFGLGYYSWVIVGPQTGSLKKVVQRKYLSFRLWVEEIKSHCFERKVPLFTKEACAKYGVELVKQFPFDLSFST